MWCVLALTAAGCAHSPEPAVSNRRPSLDAAALAAGHSHTRKPGGRSLEVWLSPWDRRPNGVLAALERSGRRLPRYLVTPVDSIRVWEWSGEPEHWIVRKLPR